MPACRPSSEIRGRKVRHDRRDATGFPEHRVGGRRIAGVSRRPEQQREMTAGATTEDTNAVWIDAVLLRVLTDEADRSPHVRHDRGQGISRAAAVSHGEYGESFLVQRGIGPGRKSTAQSPRSIATRRSRSEMRPAPFGCAGRCTSSVSARPSSSARTPHPSSPRADARVPGHADYGRRR